MESPDVVLERLTAELEAAGSVPLSCWSREELAEWAVGLQRVRACVDGLVCSVAVAAEACAVPALDGARTMRQFMAGRCSSSPADIGADVTLGRWLVEFGEVGEALGAGRITRRHALALRDLDNPRTRVALRNDVWFLVEAAASCSWSGFVEACNYWLAHTDPDGEAPKEHQRQRSCSLRTHADGTVSGRFVLDPVTGAAVKTAIDREALRLFDADAQRDASVPGGHRSNRQRMADALAGLVTRGAARPDGRIGSPLVHVVIGQQILDDALCRAASRDAGVPAFRPDGTPVPDDLDIDPSDPLRRCEFVDGTPVHPAVVVGLLGVATLRRLVLDADSEIIDLGRSVKTFPEHLKQALRARDRGRCRNPGCDAPLAWLQADHILPWSKGGITATVNGQCLCGPDNREKSDTLP